MFICSVCGCDIAMERKCGIIVEISDTEFYWFGAGYNPASKFIHYLRKNQLKTYTRIHKINNDGTTTEIEKYKYEKFERAIINAGVYLENQTRLGFSRGRKKANVSTLINAV